MNWVAEATEKLMNYADNRRTVVELAEKMRKYPALREKGDLRYRLESTLRQIRSVEMGLGVLNQEERQILEGMYLERGKYAALKLAETLGCDIKTVYARKEQALHLFTIALFGCIES